MKRSAKLVLRASGEIRGREFQLLPFEYSDVIYMADVGLLIPYISAGVSSFSALRLGSFADYGSTGAIDLEDAGKNEGRVIVLTRYVKFINTSFIYDEIALFSRREKTQYNKHYHMASPPTIF
jgi:hypothetical protein